MFAATAPMTGAETGNVQVLDAAGNTRALISHPGFEPTFVKRFGMSVPRTRDMGLRA